MTSGALDPNTFQHNFKPDVMDDESEICSDLDDHSDSDDHNYRLNVSDVDMVSSYSKPSDIAEEASHPSTDLTETLSFLKDAAFDSSPLCDHEVHFSVLTTYRRIRIGSEYYIEIKQIVSESY